MMAKFYGAVGYGESVDIGGGVWEDVITERFYQGDIIRNTRRLQEDAEKVNFNISVQNSISIVADPYATEHFFAMRYVQWMGTLWVITDVEVQFPRLILRLGGMYNGPKAPAPSNP